MLGMMANGPIILDPSPEKELAGEYLLGRIRKKIHRGGGEGRDSLEPMAPKGKCEWF